MRAALLLIISAVLVTACMKPGKVPQKPAAPTADAAGKTTPAAPKAFMVRIETVAAEKSEAAKSDDKKSADALLEVGEKITKKIVTIDQGACEASVDEKGKLAIELLLKGDSAVIHKTSGEGTSLQLTVEGVVCSMTAVEAPTAEEAK